MKPWTNPLFQAHCYICGRPGYNRDAIEAWHGALFRCADGCHPEDVRRYNQRKEKQEQPVGFRDEALNI